MAASTIQASKVAALSIKELMVALNDEVLPNADDLRAQGYITVLEYAKASGKNTNTAKRLLDASDRVEKRKAKSKGNVMMMYRVKQ